MYILFLALARVFELTISVDFVSRISKTLMPLLMKLCNSRNKIDHELQSQSIDTKTTGVKESCIFHQLSSYNVIPNACVDVMHDVLEGPCQCDLGHLLYRWISIEKRFTLIELNTIIQGY